jgi:dissimilatory sulfite reductase (desulfoviridin) alpha/beta subunit
LDAIDWENKIIRDVCTGEGKCIGLCDSFKADRVISIFVGGKGGRTYKEGKHLIDLKTEDDVLLVIDELISLYAKFGKGRMADFIENYGIERLKRDLRTLLCQKDF